MEREMLHLADMRSIIEAQDFPQDRRYRKKDVLTWIF